MQADLYQKYRLGRAIALELNGRRTGVEHRGAASKELPGQREAAML
jgi:hypothetical protein